VATRTNLPKHLVLLAVAEFFNQHMVNIWNSLDFTSLTSFKTFKMNINNVGYSDFL